MANKWTDEQQTAIDLRNCSILVSAAAGSGKTAVLVERILKKVMDISHPVNIDSMVIVTFTKAAAAEMRERIRKAIESEAAKYPENSHLQKQKTLIHNANITTIDSFCTMILRNHFEETDIDPSFRVADSGEAKLLQKEAVGELLEKYYQQEETGEMGGQFENFVECYAPGRSDRVIEDFILNLYEFSSSFPFPEKWLDECEQMYNCESLQIFEKLDWVKLLKEDMLMFAEHAYNAAQNAYNISLSESGPYMYTEVLSYYLTTSEALCKCEEISDMYEILINFKPKALSAKKDAAVCKELREQAKKYKDECKKSLDSLKKKYFYSPPSIIVQDLYKMKDNVHMLVTLVKDFIHLYGEKKREKNLLDFNDLEHFALNILVNSEGNPSEIAKEYAAYFDEIMIDEYQDSNYVQEMLLSSISKRSEGKENVFMVGDAKQSIYRFRMARPEIFTNKYDTYSLDNGDKRRVDLYKNFRSRSEVLNSINYIFSHIMKKTLGGIEYDNSAALYAGAKFSLPDKENEYDTEIMLYDKNCLSKEDEISPYEFEARLIALKIKQMVLSENPYMVTDKNSGLLRHCKFRDIAILVRSNTELASACMKVFEGMDIPLYVPSREGYFTAEEIETILNFLKIIDNPLQDIPFAAVLKSPIAFFTENELSLIHINNEGKCFYEKAQDFISKNLDDFSIACEEKDDIYFGVHNKLKLFLERLQFFREKADSLPLHEFIWLILDETGYGDYICAMPNGMQKKANMEALVQKAIDFENTSYIGIFQFVQYIEQIKKYNVDEGEVSIVNEQDDTVRIMTIHKSKGLEFPIVFVAGLGSRFNRKDESAAIIMHPEFGVGVNYVDAVTRQKKTSILKQLISSRIHIETVGEELRVLYVALTRAKEKLILVGGVKDIESTLNDADFVNKNDKIDMMTILNSGCYMELILASLNNHRGMSEFYRELGMEKDLFFSESEWDCNIHLSQYFVEDLINAGVLEAIEKKQNDFEFEEQKENAEISEALINMLNYEYPYKSSHIIPVKVTVSELKKNQAAEISELENNVEPLNIFGETSADEQNTDDDIIYPKFLKKDEEKITAADRGTLYHSVFEKLDFNRTATIKEIEDQIKEMFENNVLDNRLRSCVNIYTIDRFLNSSVGRRMVKAEKKGLLWREQPFIIGIDADKIYDHADENKIVLVQGIIDAFFEEESEIVLVDYKTDYVKKGMEDILIRKYKKQMDYYEYALSKMFQKRVKERIIYSTGLNKDILL